MDIFDGWEEFFSKNGFSSIHKLDKFSSGLNRTRSYYGDSSINLVLEWKDDEGNCIQVQILHKGQAVKKQKFQQAILNDGLVGLSREDWLSFPRGEKTKWWNMIASL